MNIIEKVKQMKPSQIIMSMVEGLRKRHTVIDMSDYGQVKKDGLCYGCAATNCILELDNNLFDYYKSPTTYPIQEIKDFIFWFESAINYLRMKELDYANANLDQVDLHPILFTEELENSLITLTSDFTEEDLIPYVNLAKYNEEMETQELIKKGYQELGDLQKMWIDSLRKHPERQLQSKLGEKVKDSYKACCLGEYLICSFRKNKKKIPFENGSLIDGINENRFGKPKELCTLINSYEKLKLHDDLGTFNITKVTYLPKMRNNWMNLSQINDAPTMTWTDIADFICLNHKEVFTGKI